MDAASSVPGTTDAMYNSTDPQPHSPLTLYSDAQLLEVTLSAPQAMATHHWHGQVEINIPLDGEITYLIQRQPTCIPRGHIALFWACTPHRLTDAGRCRRMALISLPMHLVLSWSLDAHLLNHLTHGRVLISTQPVTLTAREVRRWQQDLHSGRAQICQLVQDEIRLMLKRFSLSGWHARHPTDGQPAIPQEAPLSRHALAYVSQMLTYIAGHYDRALTISDVAQHTGLNDRYAMGLFQRVMRMTLKQYITAMRINHVRALLSDTDRSILDIALTAGFRSSSRFYDTFRRDTGMSPQQYRRQVRAGEDSGGAIAPDNTLEAP